MLCDERLKVLTREMKATLVLSVLSALLVPCPAQAQTRCDKVTAETACTDRPEYAWESGSCMHCSQSTAKRMAGVDFVRQIPIVC